MWKKKLNLLPPEVKNRYANRYITYAASAIGGILILALTIQYIHIGILSLQINNIVKNNEAYQKQQETPLLLLHILQQKPQVQMLVLQPSCLAERISQAYIYQSL